MKRLLSVASGAFVIVLALLVTAPGDVSVLAQNRMDFSLVATDSGHIALGLALRKLNVSGTFMQTAAHPDDEHNALYALFNYGMGLRAVDVQTTRGGGGQNEIGPELFHDMAVLRTSELLAAHRLDGAEQYFTRAIDFGYSFDPEEVIRKWGRDEIVGDFVRLIRTIRPDVVLTMNIQGGGGDRAHEATTVLTREAWRAAGDASKFPEQIREGLRPWQAMKLYFSGGFRGGGSGPGWVTPDTEAYDTLLGRTYAEIGFDAHSKHKCQGMGGVPPLPGSRGRGFFHGAYQLVETTIPAEKGKTETSMFDGVDTSLATLARFAGPNPPEALTAGLAAISADAKRAQEAFDSGNDAGTAAPVEAGLAALRALRAQLGSLPLSEAARYEIDFRLKNKERDYEDAVLAAHDVSFDAVANDGLVIAGQPVRVSLVAMNRGATPVSVTGVSIAGFDDAAGCAPKTVTKDEAYTCSADEHVPNGAKLTTPYFTDNYWAHPSNPAIDIFAPDVPFGVPFRPTPFAVTFHVKAGNVEVTKVLPVQYRYVEDIYFGDKRMELSVVPDFSLRVTPSLAVIPAPSAAGAARPVGREVDVSVTNSTKGAAQAEVRLELPAGWKAAPASVPLNFTREDESLPARFAVTAPAEVRAGEYTLRAVVTSPATGNRKFSDGYQDIEYPHVERRQVIKPAEIAVKIVDVKTTPNVAVGYINGVGDQVPPAIQQLGAKLTFIDQDELAFGDLSKFDVIMTGVRAYERREDLRAYNNRLLDYVKRGGTLIVQYNKMEFNQAEYGPYPARVGRGRVADETAPVKVLAPDNPVFNYPNKIGPATWDGWVQERGLYFLGEKDPKYVDLVSMVDSFPDNPGVQLGSFVEAKYGQGRWIYLGLGLWRQLPAGTVGAYQLLANLIALGKEPASGGMAAH